MIPAYMNWSGGKDSALALYKTLQQKRYRVERLLTSINAAHNRISMHGVRRELLLAQAEAIGIPLTTIELPEQPTMAEYEMHMMEKVRTFHQKGLKLALFGDIFLEDLRSYREQKLRQVDIEAFFPLWKINTSDLMKEFLGLGFKTMVVCVNGNYLDKSFCGRIIDETFVKDLPSGVDVCGENGEFHTFVFDGPLFQKPIPFKKGEVVYREYKAPEDDADSCRQSSTIKDKNYRFYFCDLLPITSHDNI
jgi:uncharacterized protein (TIGR00290 family)